MQVDKPSPTPNEEFIFDRIKERYDFEHRVSENNDTLASNLVGWNALIISVLLTGGGILISRGTNVIKFSMPEWLLLSSTLALLAISLSMTFIVFRLIGGYYVVPQTRALIDRYAGLSKSETMAAVGLAMSDAVENNAKKNERRSRIINISQFLFIIAMVLAVTFLIDQSAKLL